MESQQQTVLVTGGSGFIGTNLVRLLLAERPWRVVNLDALTYAGSGRNLTDLEGEPRYRFVRADICDADAVLSVFSEERPSLVLHLAAESHVDRSIHASAPFLRTNVEGTRVVLEAAREAKVERFLYCSTDEVYGDLGDQDDPNARFHETTPINPSSPYAVSKAAGDMLARAYHRTHGLWVVVTRCSNNYGPYQFPEKLIPLLISNAMDERPIPVYGDGKNVRDWIHVEDHCRGLLAALERGQAGRSYNFGGHSERENLQVVKTVLSILGRSEDLIRFVTDRPGHDLRYAIDCERARQELDWEPRDRFEEWLERTVTWYRENQTWWRRLKDEGFEDYYRKQYRDLEDTQET
ncbi:dTDP-glucose 4,6-dehydratase [Planctomycetota bacterium]